ncbi:hypothetical protein ACKWTF_002249 [Chironomus riparius]
MVKACLLLYLLLTLSLHSFGEANDVWVETNIDKLKSSLLKNYDRFARPEDASVTTNLYISLTVIHMELHETKGILETHAWIKLKWTDNKLKWNISDYDNITHFHVSADEIWTPDLTVYNSAEAQIIDHFAKTNKIIYSNGDILWVPTAKFETYCNMDLKIWPFDEQKCEIKIGSWTYNSNQINLKMDMVTPIDAKSHYNNLEWEVLNGTAERHEKFYSCCPEPYGDVTFYLNFRRRSPMFKAIAIVPAAAIVFMTLTAFWLPPQAGEKLLLNGFACIMICILLMYFSQLLPILAASSPIIVTIYSHTLYLLCISFIISAIVINMSRNRKSQPNTIIGDNQAEELKKAPFEENDDIQIIQTNIRTKAQLIQNEWIHLASIIDRIAFVIYVIIFILMGFIHFI